ncbi:MAG: NAD-dependent deacylase [Spirochaetia bacterium]|nr:NAD-dependent deacylase [Spirochaetia bacterium]
MDQALSRKIERTAEIIRDAKNLLFITGAGISADSGLPTYRGIGGLYNDKKTDEGYPIEDALSGSMLRHRPEITWKYIAQIEKACRNAQYNRAHKIIADLEENKRVCVLTQNIDGFHGDAGSKNLIEIHGNIRKVFCESCLYSKLPANYDSFEIPPLCPECGGILRPEVVLFGEMLPEDAVYKLDRELSQGFDAVISIGTTSVFPYISGPVIIASRQGIPTIEINPTSTEVSNTVEIKLAMGAKEALEMIASHS